MWHPAAAKTMLLIVAATAVAMVWVRQARQDERSDRYQWAQHAVNEGRLGMAQNALHKLVFDLGSRPQVTALSDLISSLQQAQNSLREQKTEQAIVILESQRERHPRQALVHFLLSRAYQIRGRHAEAKTALQQARTLAPRSKLITMEAP